MRLTVIVNGHTSTNDYSFEEAAQALADGHTKRDVVRVRVRTYGRQERDLTRSEADKLVQRAGEIVKQGETS